MHEPTTGLIGARVRRLEDPRLLTGRARFLDDLRLPGMLEAAVLRSPHPHARVLGIDTSRAEALPGVHAVVTGRDLVEVAHPQPVVWRVAADQRVTGGYALAVDRVRYVGQGVAAVAASDRYVAEDALELIEVDYEPLPAVASLEAALAPGAPRLYDDWPDNVSARLAFACGDVEAAFAEADVVVSQRFKFGRQLGCPLETRGCLATWDPFSGELDVWLSTQAPNLARELLGEVFGLPVHQIRVRVPDVGGGFGNKFDFYGDEVAACALSRRTGRPVKLVEDRLESFAATSHAREQLLEVELAATREGRFTALRGTVYGVLGGDLTTVGLGPVWLASTMLSGPYRIPNIEVAALGVLTNRSPYGSFRGWGQPKANFVHERLVELVARELGLDGNEVRRLNFVQPDEFPYFNGIAGVYDSGRYANCLDLCLEGLREHRWSERRAAARAAGRSVGIGFAFHVEATAFGPSRLLNLGGLQHSGFDEEVVRIDSTGRVTVFTGQAAMGQGIETALAQVCAESLSVPLDHVTVVSGDTATCPYTGYGTGASRAASVGGGAVIRASARLRERVLRIAGHLLEAAPGDLTIEGGRISVEGSPERFVTMAEVGDAAYRRLDGKLPEDVTPTLEERFVFEPENFAFSYGCTAVMLEVDRETGVVTLLDYLQAHDCGTIINPMIVEGQIHGGAAQALAGALWEELVYDEDGQLLTGTFMDYIIPSASELPPFTLLHMATPSPHIPGGMKGVGEGGTIGTPAAVANAIDDALGDLGVTVTTLPVTPPRLLDLIRAAGGEG